MPGLLPVNGVSCNGDIIVGIIIIIIYFLANHPLLLIVGYVAKSQHWALRVNV